MATSEGQHERAPKGSRPSPRRAGAGVAALGLLVAAAYGNALRAPLLRDSQFIIGTDPRLRELTWHNLALILSKGYWWPTYAIPLYRPFTTFTYLVNWTLLGGQSEPLGYHLVNIALHAVNAALLFALARRLLAGTRALALAPWIAAALFAVHPLQTEAVTYVVGRADELVALALLGALLCHLRTAELSDGPRRRWLGLLAALAFVGAFSKESGLLVLPALLLHDALFTWPRLSGSPRERLVALGRSRGVGYLVAGLPIVALPLARYLAVIRDAPFLGWPFIDNPLISVGSAVRAMTAMKIFALQLGLLFFPRTLSMDYSYDAIPLFGSPGSTGDALGWLGLALALGSLGLALALRRRAPGVAFGLLLFLGGWLPTSNLLFPTGSIMAERFLYVPSLGLCLAAAVALTGITRALAPRLPELVVPAAILLALGVRTHLRNAEWGDDLTLWRSAVAAQPESVRGQGGLATALWAQGATEANLDAALVHAERGVEILDAHPLPAEERDDSLYTELAHFLRLKAELLRAHDGDAQADGLLQRAWDLLQRAEELDAATNRRMQSKRREQGGASTASIEFGNHAIYLELFSTAADLQRWPEATAAAEHARTLAPLDPTAHLDLARVRLSEGRLEDAAVDTLESLLVDASNGEAWSQLQTLYSALGENSAIRQGGARRSFDASVPLVRSQLNRACGELITLLVAAGSGESARVMYQRAIDPSDLAVPPDALAAPP